jgi:hypothetical protein
MQHRNWRHHLWNNARHWLRRRSNRSSSSAGTAALKHLLDGVALTWIQAAELVLNIEARLTAKVEEIFALHV